MKKQYFLICICLIIIILSGCENNKQIEKYYFGVPIKRIVVLHEKNGSKSQKLFFINEKGLDGFWQSYDGGQRFFTEFYLGEKLDTCWQWEVFNGNIPVEDSLFKTFYDGDSIEMFAPIFYDTLKLKEYLQRRVAPFINIK